MRKFIALGVALAAVLAIAGTAYAAIQQTYTVKISPSKGKKNSTVDLKLNAKDPATKGQLPSRAVKVVIRDPGTFIKKGAPMCAVSTAQVAAAQCNAKTIVGSGQVKAAITTAVISRAVGPVKAYNLTPGPGEVARLGLVVATKTVKGDGTGALPPGIASTTTFDTKITRKGGKSVLSTTVPKVEPLGSGNGEVILTDFQLKIDKRKFHKNGTCKVKRHKRKGTLTYTAAFNYVNGTSKNITTKVKCTK